MKIKTQDLTGAALDWAVAEAAGRYGAWTRDEQYPGTSMLDISIYDGKLFVYAGGREFTAWAPSTDWSQGGPIIEQWEISTLPPYAPHPDSALSKQWLTHCLKAPHLKDGKGPAKGHGPTPLIAAMRCFVASRLGNKIKVPEELT